MDIEPNLEDNLNDSLIEKSIAWENKILKEMNAELRENNHLLKEKVENMEIEIASLRNDIYKNEWECPKKQKVLEMIQTSQHSFEIKLESLIDSINFLKSQTMNDASRADMADSTKIINSKAEQNINSIKKLDIQIKTTTEKNPSIQYSEVLKKDKSLRGTDNTDTLRGYSQHQMENEDFQQDDTTNRNKSKWIEVGKGKERNRSSSKKGEGEDKSSKPSNFSKKGEGEDKSDIFLIYTNVSK
ncbi:hypothetical protein JTB14_027083 [Gonioctena quinquepunctata]|nr:hypothetical protein JTB14_027083 [Gonioctena quinquepunctata]